MIMIDYACLSRENSNKKYYMLHQNNERLALVTGGGSGIGFAIAEKLTANGITTIIVGRNQEKLDCAQSKLGDHCKSIVFDLTDLAAIPSLVQKIQQDYGSIDILVNSAGINLKKDFTEVSDSEFQQVMHTNVTASFVLSREVVKGMLQKGRGSIINISSMAAKYGIPKVIAYTASKSAIEGMTRSMAVDLSPKGIRVNCIAPGFITTNMTATAMNNDPDRKAKVLSRTPMGVFGDPSDIADAVYFLASDDAKYITGLVMPVDGGNSIGF